MSGTSTARKYAAKISNQFMPCDLLAMPIPVNLAAGQTDIFDMEIPITAGVIDQVQGVFVDNADSAGTLYITTSLSNQRVIVPPYSQAYLPILAPTPNTLTFRAVGAAVTAALQFMNIPMPLAVWPVISPANSLVGVSPVSRSVVTVAATSTPLMAANPNRQYMLIKSPVTADVWFNPIGGVAAVSGLDCIQILAGPYLYESGRKCFTGAVNYFCVTGALNLTALEG